MSNKIYFILAVLFAGAISAVMYKQVGFAVALIIGGSAILALFAWLFTTYKNPADPKSVLPVYLLGVAAQIVHTGEEYISDFPFHLKELFTLNPILTRDVFAIAVMSVFAAVWVLAGYGLIKRNPFANYLVWFFVIGPGFVNSIAHFTFPVLLSSLYFPGLITVILPTVASVVIAKKLISKRNLTSAQPAQ